ncbi:hypothetical protein AGMMS49546_13480 [Spirochaetia bacterium]|nr:hypothetical protein AGMMS49546_13480 [Spirochaetia bacterium]
MKNYKVIFMGMLALALVFGLAGCQNPVDNGKWYDFNYNNTGPNLLTGKTLYVGTANADAANQWVTFTNDSEFVLYDKRTDNPTKAIASGDYNYKTPNNSVTYKFKRKLPPPTMTPEQIQAYSNSWTAAGGELEFLSGLQAIQNAKDDKGLIDEVAIGHSQSSYYKAHPTVWLKWTYGLNAVESDVLNNTTYTSLQEYVNDYFTNNFTIDAPYYNVQGQGFILNGKAVSYLLNLSNGY